MRGVGVIGRVGAGAGDALQLASGEVIVVDLAAVWQVDDVASTCGIVRVSGDLRLKNWLEEPGAWRGLRRGDSMEAAVIEVADSGGAIAGIGLGCDVPVRIIAVGSGTDLATDGIVSGDGSESTTGELAHKRCTIR